jgi:thymidylate kinase
MRGKLVAFFGTDGTGKSTIANIVEAECNIRGVATRRFHWRPRLLPSRKVDLSNIDVTHPDDLVKRNLVISLVTYIYCYSDFLFAYLLNFYPFMKKGGIILYERYYYDILFHPRRYHTQEIRHIAKLLVQLIPKPDVIVFLYGQPEVIQSRKLELTLDEISRQQDIMREYFREYGTVLSVDVTNTAPREVAEIVLKRCVSCEYE